MSKKYDERLRAYARRLRELQQVETSLIADHIESHIESFEDGETDDEKHELIVYGLDRLIEGLRGAIYDLPAPPKKQGRDRS